MREVCVPISALAGGVQRERRAEMKGPLIGSISSRLPSTARLTAVCLIRAMSSSLLTEQGANGSRWR
jgi:hypothetical protein